ncbi:MAG: EF-P beta-lysylation protein EpmB [Waddliaceae bacterium]|nr:EF-P beta-lysylation protein EpmB [Waddliaceae bacterium]
MTQPLWRKIQRNNFRSWEALVSFLELDATHREKTLKQSHFPINIPQRLAGKMKKNCIDDPILRQFLPLEDELKSEEGYSLDAVGDFAARKQGSSRLLHKYQDRALLIPTSACAMHCRYCFRQHYEYGAVDNIDKELGIITNDSSIHEIILSGGDPLSWSHARLGELIKALEEIPHLQRLRFHTRFPVGIPERIDEAFLDMIRQSRLQFWFVLHSNHPLELDQDVLHAMKLILCTGTPVLNQSVLLKGVNDCVDTLEELIRKLVDHGIQPYYLHELDEIQGAMHFKVSRSNALKLMEELQKRLPGYGLPRYVKEEAGKSSKTIVF